MESVEEMCDYVALIDHAKKVLDGKVFDVREQFKKNIFGVTLADINTDAFDQFRNQYQIQEYVTQNQLVSFDLKNDNDQHMVLNELMKVGKIRSFDEKIPSMNEVFINAVSAGKR
jgi:ABC-2 type transport system ATP-binding protein